MMIKANSSRPNVGAQVEASSLIDPVARNKNSFVLGRVFLLLLLLLSVVHAQPIYVGTFSYHTYRDPTTNATIDSFLEPFFVGMYSAIQAVNTAGGIHGKQIQLIECETGFIHQKYLDCMDQWKTQYYPNMVAIASVLHDQVFQVMMPKLQEQNIMLIDPLVSGDIGRPPKTTFSDNWVYLTADSRMQLISLVKKAVNVLHLRRIAFLSSTDAAEEKEAELIAICASLNVTYVGSFSVLPSGSNATWVWPTKEYTDFLALRPQAMITFMSPDPRNLNVLIDIMNQSHYRTNNVDPNVVLLAASPTIDIILGAAYLIQATYRVPVRLKNRLFVTVNTPLMDDDYRYDISRHARADVTTYYGTPDFAKNGTGFIIHLQQTWTQLKFVAEVVKRMQPSNLTKDAFIDTVFDSASFPIDDVLFGMFSRGCAGNRKALNIQCECGQGFRTVDLYSVTPFLSLAVDLSAQVVAPFTECGSASITVPYPLIYASVRGSDLLRSTTAAKMIAGVAAQQQQDSSATNAGWEYLNYSSSATSANSSQIAANVSLLNSERYVSAIVTSVLPTYSIDMGGLALIDPLVFPASPAPPTFEYNVVFISATLQQELVALGKIAAARGWSVSVLARGEARNDIIDAMVKSLNTFGMSPVAAIDAGADTTAALSLPSNPPSSALFIAGITLPSHVDSIAQYLTNNPQAVVMLPFSEVSVLYGSITAALNTSSLASRLVFATSMRNWNAPNMSSNLLSPLMTAYFASVPSTNWNPLSLRGFIASAALQQICSQIRGVLSSFAILKEIYSTSVIALSSADFIGAYSSSKCFASSDTVCQTNVGARTINVLSLSDVTLNASVTQQYQSSYVFSTGRLDYQPLPSAASGLSSGAILGIAIGASIGGILLIALVCWSRAGGRNNRHAPKNPDVPVTLIFTDIQSSTGLWAANPDVMARALETHHAIIRRLIVKHKGYEVKTIGDSFMIACSTPNSALALAVELQHAFFTHDWMTSEIDDAYREFEREKFVDTGIPPPTAELPIEIYSKMWNGIRVRIGIHTGLAEIKFDEITRGFDYYGSVSNIAARTESSGHGGQVVITSATLNALGEHSSEYVVIPLGATSLRGVPEPIELFQVNTVADRKFLDIKKEDEVDDNSDEDESTMASTVSTKEKYMSQLAPHSDTHSGTASHQDLTSGPAGVAAGGGDDVTSLTSESTRMGGGEKNWRSVSVAFLTILLSTCSESLRKSVLDVLCQRWHVQVTGVHTGRLRDDPYVLAVSKRIAPMMKKRCGQTILNGNFTNPTTTAAQTGKKK